ncbi:DUF6622 family protein [Kalamiella sp. sgz302252]|uniref:DUF6622 family protein n=1 Tax=Pantoea sp. sgz302252 TaxID=3341827 RepID=UPI0036D3DFC1
MLEIAAHTPKWVFLLFILLLWLSIKSCFPREVNPRRALISPLAFLALSLHTFMQYPHLVSDMAAWLAGAMIGAALSYSLLQSQRFRLGKNKLTLVAPGTPVILVITLAYFLLRYYLGYQEALRADKQAVPLPQLLLMFSSAGFITGFFICRAWLLLKNYNLLSRAVAP